MRYMSMHYELLKPLMAKILKIFDYGKTRTAFSIKEEKKGTKFTLMNETGKDKLLNPLFLTLMC